MLLPLNRANFGKKFIWPHLRAREFYRTRSLSFSPKAGRIHQRLLRAAPGSEKAFAAAFEAVPALTASTRNGRPGKRFSKVGHAVGS